MAGPQPSLHRLAARNVVVGETEFLSVPLPLPWRLTRAVVTPEVRTTRRAGERVWVASGETRHVVFDRARNLGLELVVRIVTPPWRVSPIPRRKVRQVLEEGLTTCNGHEARYQIAQRRRGFLMRGEEQVLVVAFACPATDRGILVEIAGQCMASELREFLRVMSELECH